MEITLTIHDPRDLEILMPLLERLKIQISTKKAAAIAVKSQSAAKKQQLLAIIEAGGDASNFGDAAEWERRERQERNLPFNEPSIL
jgi:hypothetical protein